jgi:RimJ/RimL family protein N-acetyltransferase
MNFNLQPTLKNEFVSIKPLNQTDFEMLFAVASDPLIWEQHPNKNRYQKDVFKIFFEGAIASNGAFLVSDAKNNKIIGSSRFYGLDTKTNSISIGYTFISKEYWGKNYNRSLKLLMIDHAFRFVNSITFHVGSMNIRSQKAMEKIGAKKTGEIEMSYYGEENKLNFIYEINKDEWMSH